MMHPLAKLDRRYVWHPFTQMQDWAKHEPIVIVEGHGTFLRDACGREYLDANSSIWTNLHGHNHPRINAAIGRQLAKIAHSSALGFANEPASLLAEQLVQAANPAATQGKDPAARRLAKVFFSDDGSTAVEVALKLAYEYTRRTGRRSAPKFLSLDGAYHGDTVGAVALGHIELFHQAYAGLLFKTDRVMAPYCYRCPFNRARPERADARTYRKCEWQCLDQVERKFRNQTRRGDPYAAFVVEPRIQGAAGLIPQPAGWLARAAQIAREHGTLLIADEVMTGFGRTGSRPRTASPEALIAPCADSRARNVRCAESNAKSNEVSLFACHLEGVQPDFLALAKGLTGGYLPMAATLTTSRVYKEFLGEYHEFKTFFHGHSFTGNQLGAAAALESLALLQSRTSARARQELERALAHELQNLWRYPQVGDIRQVGLVAGIELVRDWHSKAPFALREQAGIRVCAAMAKRGVLTRPIGNVLVLMPPYCTTANQVKEMVAVMGTAIDAEL
jgi:adenosylmethionine---8-amino-7-oxononanoate aminotransferase